MLQRRTLSPPLHLPFSPPRSAPGHCRSCFVSGKIRRLCGFSKKAAWGGTTFASFLGFRRASLSFGSALYHVRSGAGGSKARSARRVEPTFIGSDKKRKGLPTLPTLPSRPLPSAPFGDSCGRNKTEMWKAISALPCHGRGIWTGRLTRGSAKQLSLRLAMQDSCGTRSGRTAQKTHI